MTKEKENKPVKQKKELRSSKASFITSPIAEYENPWLYKESYKTEVNDVKDFRLLVTDCRFFYRRDALASTTINKLVDIGINDLTIIKNGLTDNEFKIFEGLKDELLQFAEDMALEFLISGLVIPDIKFARLTKEEIVDMGIVVKKYDNLYLPKSMWLYNPNTVVIKETMFMDKPAYYVEIPEQLRLFIQSEGTYPDNTKDKDAYDKIKELYPSFVQQVKEGKTEFLIEDDNLVIRRKVLTDGPYPTPYLMAAIDPLKHKRTLRRMDYSVATKVLSAILHVKIGSDEYPMTESEEDKDRLDDIKSALVWRNTFNNQIENIFQLFTDHTVEMSWVFPDTEALLNEGKYKDINEDIIFALGFPRTLIVGESERTGTSNPEYAAMSPVKTMENFREKILRILRYIVEEISKGNNFKSSPKIDFAPINLHDFRTFIEGLDKLFQSGSLSREDYAKPFGFDYSDQFEKRKAEQKELEEYGISEFGSNPFSRQPDIKPNGANNTNEEELVDGKPVKKPAETITKKSKK